MPPSLSRATLNTSTDIRRRSQLQARPSGFSKFIDAADAESGKGAFGNVQMGARGAENGAANGNHGNGYGFSNGAATNGNGFISNMHHR